MRHRRLVSVRRTLAVFLAAAISLPVASASAADIQEPSGLASWRSVGWAHTGATLSDSANSFDDGHASPVVFVLPDEMWDARRAWPYIDRLSSRGIAVLELWSGHEQGLGLAEARAAMASATDELGLDPSRVALLGFGAGGRLALALAGPERPAVALYPACDGASAPDVEARVLVLHPDDAAEARACAALAAGRPGARSGRASAGAGHGWDVLGERTDGRTLLPHPGAPDTLARRLRAQPDDWATNRAARAVSDFLMGDSSAHLPARNAP